MKNVSAHKLVNQAPTKIKLYNLRVNLVRLGRINLKVAKVIVLRVLLVQPAQQDRQAVVPVNV